MKIKFVDDLPKWFDIKNYSWTHTLDGSSLVLEATYRADFMFFAGMDKEPIFWRTNWESAVTRGGRLISEPKSAGVDEPLAEFEVQGNFPDFLDHLCDGTSAIQPLTVSRISEYPAIRSTKTLRFHPL